MGKCGPKSSFVNVACPNKDFKNYGKIENGNMIDNGTLYKTKMLIFINIFALHQCSKSLQMQDTISHDLKTKDVDEKKLFFFLKMIFKRYEYLDQ
ncbi:MAG: hypothetical protein LBB45_08385 [Methanobrevibacter sp.]|nr:hypothetical protein [Candidatus Methanovirga basalitermitum]